MKRRSAIVTFGVVLVGLFAAGQVIAATQVKTTVTISSGNGDRFNGKVSAGKKACIKGRKVTLYVYAATSGQRTDARYPGYEAVGKATTRANGTWLITASGEEKFLEGDYRASVAAKKVTSGGETFMCLARWGPTTHA